MADPNLVLAIGTAAWLGVLTSISPCPLATNVAAIAFVSRDGGTPRRALAAGLLYTLGRSLAYVALAALAVFALGQLLHVSTFLQSTFYKLLGPLLILVGMVLVGLIDLKLPQRSPVVSEDRVRRGGMWAALPLGALFALSFCPVSAGLFFGALVPLAVQADSRVVVPAVYGLGTGLPVVVFAVLLVLGAQWIGRAFRVMTRIERAVRPITGVIFILAGLYLTATHLLGLGLS
jgi:cytochrome c biogenesis protein CcdA